MQSEEIKFNFQKKKMAYFLKIVIKMINQVNFSLCNFPHNYEEYARLCHSVPSGKALSSIFRGGVVSLRKYLSLLGWQKCVVIAFQSEQPCLIESL